MIESRDYAVGFDEAIEYAQRVYRRLIRKIGSGTLADIFDGEMSAIRIIEKFSFKDIEKRLEEYDEIRVGDEVVSCDGNGERLGGEPWVVKEIQYGIAYGFGLNVNHDFPIAKLSKTGRHFDEVEILLNKMRGDV